jgi:Flp pilus assembly protein TadD
MSACARRRAVFAPLAAATGLMVAALQVAPCEARPGWRADAGVGGDRREADGGVGPGENALDSAMNGMALNRAAEARILLKKKDYTGALALYREAHDLAPANPEIANNLGYIYYLLGNYDEAERLYRLALTLEPDRYAAHLNLADLLVEHGATPERVKEARALLLRARELKGNRLPVIIRQARTAVADGDFAAAEASYQEFASLKPPSPKVSLEIGDFYRDQGRTEEALAWYRAVEDEDLGKEAAARIWELEVEKQSKKFGWASSTGVIPIRARMLATRGRALLSKRQYEEAERLLLEALTLAPSFSMARADLGDIMRQTGRPTEAEVEYLRAIAVDHENAEILARLGELYLASAAGKPRFAEAAIFLGRACALRPDWTGLELKLATALQGAGDMFGALDHVNRYLAGVHSDAEQRAALALKRSLEALVPPSALVGPGMITSAFEPIKGMSEQLAVALGKARAHLARGEVDAAMAVLHELPESERGVDVLNLESRILLGSGRLAEAARAMQGSLRADESQAVVHGQLGSILLELGRRDEARLHFERSEQLGDTSAMFLLAKLDVGGREPGLTSWVHDLWGVVPLFRSLERLDAFLDTGGASVYRREAESLRQIVRDRLAVVGAACAGALVLFLAGLVVVLRRIYGGADLLSLIAKHPEAGPDVQRVLSAVRHEVLKHNTMMLDGLLSAMEGGGDAADLAVHFGKAIGGVGAGGGLEHRLGGYVDALRRIGDANRMRLNLTRRDPAMAPLLRGIRILDRAGAKLVRYAHLKDGDRAVLYRRLKVAAHLLNTTGYEAVRDLLDRLRVLVVDEELLRAIFRRCSREPSFSAVRFAPLEIEFNVAGRAGIHVPRAAFEDIMANLVRNAVQSSLEYGEGRDVVHIGFGVASEMDAVTGLERVVFEVRDRSRRVLTAEMLRGRYIERGLGLTADLVSRYDGTLDVVVGKGAWSKAVAVKLPLAEPGGAGAEEAE